MDPLNGLMEYLSEIFGYNPNYLIFILIIGYFLFVLFYFKTNVWKEFGTTERFFFGFILGLIVILIITPTAFSIGFFFLSLFGETISIYGLITLNTFDIFFFLIPSIIIFGCGIFCYKIKAVLASSAAYDKLINFFNQKTSYWVYLFILFFTILHIGIGWNNPYFSNDSKVLWQSIIVYFVFYSILGYFGSLILVIFPSHLSQKVSSKKIVDQILLFCFPIKFRKKINSEDKAQKKKSFIFQFFKRYPFIQKAIIVVLLSFSLIFAETSFHFLSPNVTIVETQSQNEEIEVFNDLNGSIFYLVKTSKKYYIQLPFQKMQNVNLNIPNPSNFSKYNSTFSSTWSNIPYSIEITSDSRLKPKFLLNYRNEIQSIELIIINTKQMDETPFLKMDYNDLLNLDLIEFFGPYEDNLENGSIRVTISLIINNSEDQKLTATHFALFPMAENYGNLTSFQRFENGEEKQSPSSYLKEGWLWSAFSFQPGTSMNLTFQATFNEVLQ